MGIWLQQSQIFAKIAAIGAFILQSAFRDTVDHNKKNGTSELLRWEFDFLIEDK